MAEIAKKERTTLRRRVTRKISEVGPLLQNLDAAELQANLDILKNYEAELICLDGKILTKLREDVSVSEDVLEKLEDECDEYVMRIKVCINQIIVRLNSLSCVAGNVMGGSLQSGGRVDDQPRNKIKLPNLVLPEFWADERKDKLTCKTFFENFEHLLNSYKLNSIELFNLLEKQCQGKAKAMISSLPVVNQTYEQA